MRKGFTLIELLAVIVILAIIATIAVPIVLSIIEDAKESTTLRNAEYYLDAVEQSIAKHSLNIDGAYQPSTCEIQEDGNLLCDEEVEVTVEVKGKKPSRGTITFDKGKMTNITLELENKFITQNEKNELVIGEGNGKNNSICTLKEGEPNAIGSKYQCKVKDDMEDDFADGYYFYVLSHEDDGTTNLIMDRNINSDGTPTTKAILESAKDDNGGIYNLVAYNIDGDAADVGPVTVMNFVNNATSTWENIDNLNITYDDEGKHFTGFVLNGKARLPYYNEVSDVSTDKMWLIGYLTGEEDDIFEIEGRENPIADIHGYWTLSSNVDGPISAWIVSTYGYMSDGASVRYGGFYGARPVINLKL